MRKTLLITIIILTSFIVKGQTINLVSNPDTGIGFNGSIIAFQNKIIGLYKNTDGIIQLGTYNGGIITKINNPDFGSILHRSTQLINYNNNIYFLYKTQTNDTILAKFNGSIISKIYNPTLYFSPLTNGDVRMPNCIYKNKMYLIFYDKTNNINQLVRYNGSTYETFLNPDSSLGPNGSFFTFKDNLYFSYAKVINGGWSGSILTSKIARLDLSTLTIKITNKSQGNRSWDYFYSGTADSLNGKMYLVTSYNSTDPIGSLGEFNGDSLRVIDNMNWMQQGFGSGINQGPIKFSNNLFVTSYSGVSQSYMLLRYNGNNYIPVDTTTFNSYQAPYRKQCSYFQNSLYLYHSNYNVDTKRRLRRIDTNSVQSINNPDTFASLVDIKQIINNKMVCLFYYPKPNSLSDYYYRIGVYNGSNYTLINNPDTGQGVDSYIFSSDTLNNKLYFTYINAKKKYQLGYIDFNILPLKLLSFTAKKENNIVLLNWQTANEVNVSHFNIQRSNNGKDFTSIGKVNANCCSYEFKDDIRNLELGIRNYYYRLEMVDNDGSKTYSAVQQITIKLQTPNIVLFPNPAKDLVTIECAGAKELLVIDYLGRTIKQFNNPTEHQTINTKQFAKGIYVVKAIMNNGDIKTEKLVIE